ncbi:MAG: alpha/beta fold hydrolase [Fimbriimonadales bacterium]|nr:alpha/beta fold hydrolase [Fimbriimonadales bacterium]
MHPALVCAALAASVSAPRFEHRAFTAHNGVVLPFRLVRPATGTRNAPLVVFLHGMGERGSDNEAQLFHGRAFFLRLAEKGATVVVPQCPGDGWWANLQWKGGPKIGSRPSPSGAAVLQMLTILIRELGSDRDRVVLGGLSMGGFGTFDLVARRPGLFAAAFPICGGGDPATAPRMKGVSFWVFHGAKDPVVPVVASRVMVDALRNAGAEVRYTEYPEAQHDSWTPAFAEPELADWILSQRRKP